MQSASTVAFASFEARDVDQAREMLTRAVFPLSMLPLSSDRPYWCRYEQVGFGPLVVSRAFHNAALRVTVPEVSTVYTVGFAQGGQLRSLHRGAEVEVSTTTAALFQPVGDIRVDSAAASTNFTVTLGRAELESTLSTLLGRDVAGPILFAPAMDMAGGPGQGWSRLVRTLAAETGDAHSLAAHPVVMQPMVDAILRGLLLVAEHPDRDALHEPADQCRPGPVRRAVDAIHADPAQPYTLTALARIAHVSARALQQGFHAQIGTSPMNYLRHVRLAHAHDDLRTADPARTGVAAVAYRWGFAHLGRFAAYYRAVYGCAPSETLNRC
ncbi:AraC family transcriptional regulator [Krasilnikovia sp. MM14-A1004]|uniref:AraC family transcriptional regulator n=1 Tax=Krasilnikovia sp. MM14-A1004 TaxID=3373541 RepID=UPI00399C919F